MKALLLLFIAAPAFAQVESTLLPFVSATVTGVGLGVSEGWDNEWRWANVREGRNSEAERHANSMRHSWLLVGRGGIVLSVGTTGLAPPEGWRHAMARTALYASTVGISHHIAHSIQQGQSLTYSFGTYAQQEPHSRSTTGAVMVGASLGTVAGTAYITTCEHPFSRGCLLPALAVFGAVTLSSSVVIEVLDL